MGQRINEETQRARLARRLRPLYAALRSDEFERMVTQIAEIELYGLGARAPDGGGPRETRAQPRHASSAATSPVVRHV